jgi:phenylpropionate dioxygenase-like ring-hydroxylating dioxygenase large terminal subunit
MTAQLSEACIAHARRVVADAASSVGPVAKANILPADAYVSADFWAFEKQAIFGREWLCLAHVNEVPGPGDHLYLNMAGEPLVLVRDETRTVRVLSAICQHRGHPLAAGVAEDRRQARCSNAMRLVCPYHNWSYGLNGKLIGAPAMRETTPLAELRKKISLPEVRSAIFHGLVFVNFDRNAAPLAPSLSRVGAQLATYGLEELVPGHIWEQRNLGWNWKLHHENALEPYHTDYVHKGYHAAVPAVKTEFCPFEPGDGQVMRMTGFAESDGDLFEAEGTRRLPGLRGLTNEQNSRVMFVSFMPTAVAVFQPSFLTITFLNPTSAGTLDSRRVNLYTKEAVASPHFEQLRDEQFTYMKTIILQDQVTQVALQQAYQSRFTPRGTLSRLESALPQLNQWSLERYRRALDEIGAATATPG